MNKKNNKSNKLYYTFILFSILSVVFWFMTKLSKEYDTSIKYPVSYINLPSNKLLQEKPLEYIDIRIKATGFKLISSKVSPLKLTIDASNIYGKSLTNYYLFNLCLYIFIYIIFINSIKNVINNLFIELISFKLSV